MWKFDFFPGIFSPNSTRKKTNKIKEIGLEFAYVSYPVCLFKKYEFVKFKIKIAQKWFLILTIMDNNVSETTSEYFKWIKDKKIVDEHCRAVVGIWESKGYTMPKWVQFD